MGAYASCLAQLPASEGLFVVVEMDTDYIAVVEPLDRLLQIRHSRQICMADVHCGINTQNTRCRALALGHCPARRAPLPHFRHPWGSLR